MTKPPGVAAAVGCLLAISIGFRCGATDVPTPIERGTEKVLEEPEKPKADKSRYNLFNPVPADLMRELNTDRPDQTESPYTVDAGHFQAEWTVFAFTHDQREGERTDSFQYLSPNLKLGLTNRIDLQFVFDGYEVQKERFRDADGVISHQTLQGAGDLTTRLKINLFGNDEGKIAVGIMPVVKVPTNQDHLGNRSVEGGLIFPVAVSLPHDWDMGFMTEVDARRAEGERHYHAEFLNTITFGYSFTQKFRGYVEFAATVNMIQASRWIGQVDAGVSYGVTRNLQLDCGANVGVTRSAPAVQPFVGLTFRF
jgi:hypothetical protein